MKRATFEKILIVGTVFAALLTDGNACTPATTTTGVSATSGGPLYISPQSATVAINGNLNFYAQGGTPPYAFYKVPNSGSGTVVAASGTYTAPSTTGTDQVELVDSSPIQQISVATITITTSGGNGGTGTVGISPSAVNLAPLATQQFTGINGSGQYSFSHVNGSGNGSITSGGFYTAPSSTGANQTDQVEVVDITDNAVAIAVITISASTSGSLILSPNAVNVQAGGTYDGWSVTGAVGSYNFYPAPGNSCGSGVISGTIYTNGDYTAPSSAATDTICVRDSAGNVAFATVNVSGTTLTATPISIYRFYNSSSQDYLFSISNTEGTCTGGNGFCYQEVAFQIYSDNSITGTIGLYRCRYALSGNQYHFLSTDPSCEGHILDEVNGGSNILGYIYPSSGGTFLYPLYRFVSANQHAWLTTSNANDEFTAAPGNFTLSYQMGYVGAP